MDKRKLRKTMACKKMRVLVSHCCGKRQETKPETSVNFARITGSEDKSRDKKMVKVCDFETTHFVTRKRLQRRKRVK